MANDSLTRWASRFGHARRGSMAVSAGMVMSMVAGASLFALDYTRAMKVRSDLQHAADTASIALARQLPFLLVSDGQQTTTVSNETLTSIGTPIVEINLQDNEVPHTTEVVKQSDSRVQVTVVADYKPLFGSLYGGLDGGISVLSTAESFGADDICLISLGVKSSEPGIDGDDFSSIKATNCGVYSSAPGADSLTLTAAATIDAKLICSAGGYNGGTSNTTSTVVTDCQQIADPLSDRIAAPDPAAACDHNDVTFDGGTHTMDPGIYCGKTDLRNGADVRMNPGDYVFRDGEFHAHDTSRVTGTDVSLYFDDEKSQLKFLDESVVDLSAPVLGPNAGILVASRDLCPANSANGACNSNRSHDLASTNIKRLLGTLHLPSDEVVVSTTRPVSPDAAFTIIVTGKLVMKQSPSLVLNTDYAATNVPVPKGFTGQARARIVK